MTRPTKRSQSAARQQAAAAAMAGAVDLSALKERAEAQRAAAARPTPPPGAAPDAPASGPAGQMVLDVTDATFETEVLRRSTAQLVLVDLWAEWCGPCKQLSPVLESLAARSDGRWVLAKIDVDANPGVAQAFRVQSIPMVVAIALGQPVAAFNGVRSESEISSWVDDILAQIGDQLTGAPAGGGSAGSAPAPEPEDPLFLDAETKLDAGDVDGALAAYRAIVESDPGNAEAIAAVRNLEFMLRARAHDRSIVETAAPDDVDAQLAAADVLLASAQPEAAFDRIIAVVKATAGDDRTRARTRLLELFELFEPSEPFVVAARRKLASALY